MRVLVITALLVFVLDQLLKYFLVATGASFLINDSRLVYISLPFYATFIAFIYFFTKRHLKSYMWFNVAVGLVLGGGASNIIDAVARSGIIDYLSFFGFVHFNGADVAVTLGLLCISYYVLIAKKPFRYI